MEVDLNLMTRTSNFIIIQCIYNQCVIITFYSLRSKLGVPQTYDSPRSMFTHSHSDKEIPHNPRFFFR